MTGELGEVWVHGWVLEELRVLIEVVDIVANSEEFLLVVGASNKYTSNSNNLLLRELTHIGVLSLLTIRLFMVVYLEYELHLTWLDVLHLCLFQNLIVSAVICLTDVDDSPGEGCKKHIGRI